MKPNQIKYMVDRFLSWKLPASFSPDAGISFKPTFNDHMPRPTRHEPTGTNLFDAGQAEAMVRYMIDGIPTDSGLDQLHSDRDADLAPLLREEWKKGFIAAVDSVVAAAKDRTPEAWAALGLTKL